MISTDVYEYAYFILMGSFGAALFVVTKAKSYKDFISFKSIKHLILGPMIGFFYTCLYSEYNFPNTVMAIVAGYMGTHFINGVIDLLKQKLGEQK